MDPAAAVPPRARGPALEHAPIPSTHGRRKKEGCCCGGQDEGIAVGGGKRMGHVTTHWHTIGQLKAGRPEKEVRSRRAGGCRGKQQPFPFIPPPAGPQRCVPPATQPRHPVWQPERIAGAVKIDQSMRVRPEGSRHNAGPFTKRTGWVGASGWGPLVWGPEPFMAAAKRLQNPHVGLVAPSPLSARRRFTPRLSRARLAIKAAYVPRYSVHLGHPLPQQ